MKSKGNWLSLSSVEGWIVIKKQDIIRCESYKNHTTIITYLTSHTISKTLKDVEAKLPINQFFRIHNRHIVNINFIEKVLKAEGGSAVLKNGDNVPISQSKKSNFFT